MNTYRILTLDDSQNLFDDLYILAKELKSKAPQINWIVGEEKILNQKNKFEFRLCLKVAKEQYEAANYLYQLTLGNRKNEFSHHPALNRLWENQSYLTHLCSFPVKKADLESFLNQLAAILSEMYHIGTQIPNGVNLHMQMEVEEFHQMNEICIQSYPQVQTEMNIINKNLNEIIYKTTKFCSFDPDVDYPLEAGIVYEIYQSFHSLDGWGKKLLDTIQFIHELKNNLIAAKRSNLFVEKGRLNLKEAAIQWVKNLVASRKLIGEKNPFMWEQLELFDTVNNNLYSFSLTGFADEPAVFIQSSFDGIKFGYHSIQWDGPSDPAPIKIIKSTLPWESLEDLSEEECEELFIDTLLKTIYSRKRQYKTCQFCGEKFPPEHRFNQKTCHGCASEHFEIVY